MKERIVSLADLLDHFGRRTELREEFLQEVHPPPPVMVEDHLEYEVEDLIWHRGKGTRRQYFGALERVFIY